MQRSIFVSSTFQDMNLERDAIHTHIIPAINAIAKKSGESISVCDLRWGINTSDMNEAEGSKKVLKACLREIDRCRPYMIVLLGYRYGWIPDHDLIMQTVQEKTNFSLKRSDISVTELEIEYGSLSKLEDIDRTLFYFREIAGEHDSIYDPESELHKKKLELLKKKISSLPNAHIRTYHLNMQAQEQSMKAFSRMVYGDLLSLMQEQWEKNKNLDPFAIDQKSQWDFLFEKNAQFLARNEQLKAVVHKLTDKGQNILIHGKTGSGKSTFISRMGKTLSDNGMDVVPIYCGYTNLTTSGLDLLKYIVYETERRLNLDHFMDHLPASPPNRGDWRQRLKQVLERYGYSDNRMLVFLIDGVDQLTMDEIAENYSYLPEKPYTNIVFVLSMVTTAKMPLKQHILIDDLTEAERRDVVAGILAGRHRELSETVIEKMLRLPNAKLPLYLSLIVQRLIMMDNDDFQELYQFGRGIEGINQYQLKLIDKCPDSLSDLSVYVLGKASSQVGGEPVKIMGYYLALSRHGLRFSDLEMLVSSLRNQAGVRITLTMADAAAFLQYSDSFFFIRNDGRIDFTHKCFRDGLKDSLANNQTAFHRIIAKWLEHLPSDDAIRNSELGWHLFQGDAIEHFAYLRTQEADNLPLQAAAAKDLAEFSTEDHAVRLIHAISRISDEPFFMDFSGFIGSHVFFELPDTHYGLEIRKNIISALLAIQLEKDNDNFNYGLQWEVSVLLERLSMIEHEFDTKEHDLEARAYAEQCLQIRKSLLDMLQLIKDRNLQKPFMLFEVESIGRRLTTPLTQEQANSAVDAHYLENLRGICVANEMLAKALKNDYPDTAEEAVSFLEESLSIRNRIFHSEKEHSFLMHDEASELATIHLEIAQALQSLADMGSLSKAEKHILEAISINETAYEGSLSAVHSMSLSKSYRAMAGFLSDYCENRDDEAILYAEKCLPLIESLYLQKQSIAYEMELALIYSMLGNLYESKEDPSCLELSHRYYEKMSALSRGIIRKNDSALGKKLAVLGELKEAIISDRLQLEEVISYFKSAYSVAKGLFLGAKTAQNYRWLADVFNSLNQTIEKFGFAETVEGKRAMIEIKCAALDWKFMLDDLTSDEIKHCIVAYSQLGDDILDLALPDDAEWPSDWLDVLRCLEISEDMLMLMPAKRAYDISKKSLNLSRDICRKEQSLQNEDFLAVSLSKFANHCMHINLSEFSTINRELMNLAKELGAKTGNSKYFMMIFQAELGMHLLDGTSSEFIDSFLPSNKKSKPNTPKSQEKVTEKSLRDALRSVINKVKKQPKD